LRDVDELRRPDDDDFSSVFTSNVENGQDDLRSVDDNSTDLSPMTSSLSQLSGDDMMMGMLGAVTVASVDSSRRALRLSRARFTAPLLHMTSHDARKFESSLNQLRIGSAARLGRSNDIGRTERPARQQVGGLGPASDLVRLVRGVCGSDRARLAASLDSRIVGNATAVRGSNAAFVNAAR